MTGLQRENEVRRDIQHLQPVVVVDEGTCPDWQDASGSAPEITHLMIEKNCLAVSRRRPKNPANNSVPQQRPFLEE